MQPKLPHPLTNLISSNLIFIYLLNYLPSQLVYKNRSISNEAIIFYNFKYRWRWRTKEPKLNIGAHKKNIIEDEERQDREAKDEGEEALNFKKRVREEG